LGLSPAERAFDAIASLGALNEQALLIVLSQQHSNWFCELLVSADIRYKSGALGVLRVMAAHAEVLPRLECIFSVVIASHFEMHGVLRIQSFELLDALCASGFWHGVLSNHARWRDLFVVEAAEFHVPQLVAALRLLKRFLGAEELESVMASSGGLPLVVSALGSGNRTCQKEGADICQALVRRGLFADEMAAIH